MTKLQARKKAYWVKSYAKVNLSLEVLGKRDDGYHEIRSLFHEIDLFDEISFQTSDNLKVVMIFDDKISSHAAKNFPMEENTVYKVINIMKDRYSCRQNIEVEVKKNIPVAAGLGGGSSNAAAAIRSLSKLWSLNLDNKDMNDIAKDIGSDVPYFIKGGTAKVEGRGEVITPLKPLSIDLMLLVKPTFGISSAEGYELLDERKQTPSCKNNHNDKIFDSSCAYNSLQVGVCNKYSEIDQIITYMKEKGALNAILAGSGSTVIGFYDSIAICRLHSGYFEKQGYWSYIASSNHRSTGDQQVIVS